MARSRKSDSASSEKAVDESTRDDIPDAEIVESAAQKDEPGSPPPDRDDEKTEDVSASEQPETTPEAAAETGKKPEAWLIGDDTASPNSDVVIEDDRITIDPTVQEREVGAERPASDQAASATPQPVIVQKSGPGFFPLLIGGAVAAALGFGAARYGTFDAAPDTTLPDTVAAQSDRIAALEATLGQVTASLDEVLSRPDPQTALNALRDEVLAAIPATTGDSGALEAMQARIDGLAADLATATQAAGAAATGLSEDQMAAFRAELDSAVGSARAEIEAAQDRAAEIEAQAAAAAEKAAAEASVSQLAAALDSGSPYESLLAPVSALGAEIPQALSEPAATGVPTMTALQMAFPDAARAALDGAIDVDAADTATDRVLAFLRTQTNARSLTPREGDDPDAILSRAEAALRAGDLEAALGELGGLPEGGQAAMAEWIAQARTRQTALAALAELRTTIDTE